MCATSAVFDYGYQNPPWRNPDPDFTRFIPPQLPPRDLPDKDAAEAIKKFLALVEAAKEFDAAAKQRDCEDPKKAAFMTEVLERLAAIEKRLGM